MGRKPRELTANSLSGKRGAAQNPVAMSLADLGRAAEHHRPHHRARHRPGHHRGPGSPSWNVHDINTLGAFQGHEMCTPRAYVNSLSAAAADIGIVSAWKNETAHPNFAGQQAMLNVVSAAINSPELAVREQPGLGGDQVAAEAGRGRRVRRGLAAGSGSGCAGGPGRAAPLARVAERDLLEADAVVPGGPRDVQVAVDDRGRAKRRCQSAVRSVPHHCANSG